jgi:hypothetical protein
MNCTPSPIGDPITLLKGSTPTPVNLILLLWTLSIVRIHRG